MLSSLFNFIFDRKYPELKHLGGASPIFPIGNLLDFMFFLPWDLVDSYHQKYGNVFKVWAGPKPMVFMFDYEGAKEVFVNNSTEYFKEMPTRALIPSLGRSSTFNSNGTKWQVNKDNSFFSSPDFQKYLNKQYAVIQSRIPELIKKHELTRSSSYFETKCYYLMMDILGIMISGHEIPHDVKTSYMNQGFFADLSIKMNIPISTPKFKRNKNIWFNYWKREVERQDAGGIIKFFLKGSSFDRYSFVNELSNIFWGGGFSTNATLVNVLYHLGQNLEVYNELKGSLDENSIKNYRAVHSHSLLKNVINETLRIDPPIPIYGRSVLATETKLQDLKLRKGTIVIFSCRPFHLSEKNWVQPLTFDPHRWKGVKVDKKTYSNSNFMPFGLGERSCLGKEMAIFVLKSVLANVIPHFSPQIPPQNREYRFFFGCQLPKNVKGGLTPLE